MRWFSILINDNDYSYSPQLISTFYEKRMTIFKHSKLNNTSIIRFYSDLDSVEIVKIIYKYFQNVLSKDIKIYRGMMRFSENEVIEYKYDIVGFDALVYETNESVNMTSSIYRYRLGGFVLIGTYILFLMIGIGVVLEGILHNLIFLIVFGILLIFVAFKSIVMTPHELSLTPKGILMKHLVHRKEIVFSEIISVRIHMTRGYWVTIESNFGISKFPINGFTKLEREEELISTVISRSNLVLFSGRNKLDCCYESFELI